MTRRSYLPVALAVLLIPFPTAGLAAIPDDADLGGRAWADTDADGQEDESESGVPGIVAVLLGRMDGQPDFTQVDQTTTDTDGAYGFGGLQPGEYIVQFRLPEDAGFSGAITFTRKDVGDDDERDSDADPFTGRPGAPGPSEPRAGRGPACRPQQRDLRVGLGGPG